MRAAGGVQCVALDHRCSLLPEPSPAARGTPSGKLHLGPCHCKRRPESPGRHAIQPWGHRCHCAGDGVEARRAR